MAQRQLTWNGIRLALVDKLIILQRFYAPPEFALPILAALESVARSRKVKFWFAICAVLAMAALPVAWIHARYVAAFTTAVYSLTLFGLRSLRRWKPAGRPVGLGMARALVLFHLLLLPAGVGALALLHAAGHLESAWARKRQSIQAELESVPGQHLVLVRYPAAFDPGQDLVFNPADIDHAKVVWAREIPGLDMRPLLDYFGGRRLWLVEAGSNPQLYACESAGASIGTPCGTPNVCLKARASPVKR